MHCAQSTRIQSRAEAGEMTIPQKSLIWALITVVVVLLVAGVSAGEGGDHVLEVRLTFNPTRVRFFESSKT